MARSFANFPDYPPTFDRTRLPPSGRPAIIGSMLCPMTGDEHRLFWMRSAWWCEDCRQKVESCCEGGGCPSVVEVARAPEGVGDRTGDPRIDSTKWSSRPDNAVR